MLPGRRTRPGPWRLTNRKEATVSQSACGREGLGREAAFESTNEDPAESEAEGSPSREGPESLRGRGRGEYKAGRGGRERERGRQTAEGGRDDDGKKEKPTTTTAADHCTGYNATGVRLLREGEEEDGQRYIILKTRSGSK